MRNGTAPGRDGMSPDMFKTIQRFVPALQSLADVFTGILKTGKIPDGWKIAQVVPTPKPGDLTETRKWRGIALLQIGYKTFCFRACSGLSFEMESRHILAPEQHAFRPGKNTIQAAGCLLEVLMRRYRADAFCTCLLLTKFTSV